MDEAKELARHFSTKARRLTAVGGIIVEKSPLTEEIFLHRRKELKFQESFWLCLNDGMAKDAAIARACFDTNVTVEWANKFLESKRYKAWAADRFRELCINRGLTQEWFLAQQYGIYDGSIQKNDNQMKALDNIGERVAPKIQKMEHRVEKVEATALDDYMKVQEEVAALEKKLIEAHRPVETKAA